MCVKEYTRDGKKARNIGAGTKLYYHVVDRNRNEVGGILTEEYTKDGVEVKRVSNRVMTVRLEIEGVMMNVVCGRVQQDRKLVTGKNAARQHQMIVCWMTLVGLGLGLARGTVFRGRFYEEEMG